MHLAWVFMSDENCLFAIGRRHTRRHYDTIWCQNKVRFWWPKYWPVCDLFLLSVASGAWNADWAVPPSLIKIGPDSSNDPACGIRRGRLTIKGWIDDCIPTELGGESWPLPLNLGLKLQKLSNRVSIWSLKALLIKWKRLPSKFVYDAPFLTLDIGCEALLTISFAATTEHTFIRGTHIRHWLLVLTSD